MATEQPHMHHPMLDDPNHCAADDCGKHYADMIHAPAAAFRRLRELPPDLRPLGQYERASGTPREAAPATHTGRPAMHPGTEEVLSIRCPVSRCGEVLPQTLLRNHLIGGHNMPEDQADRMLASLFNLPDPEGRRQPITNFVDGPGNDLTEYCDHPNGFGTTGCPCGAVREGEDDPVTFRNLNTGGDERAVDCPECSTVWPLGRVRRHLTEQHGYRPTKVDDFLAKIGMEDVSPLVPVSDAIWGHQVNCPGECGNAFVKGNIRRHLQTVHKWTGDMWEDWAESVNFLELPSVPKSILDDIEAMGKRADAELAKFLNPDITMEQIMSDATAPDPHEAMRKELSDWWVKLANQEADKVVPKAVEYGALDLIQIGQDMALCFGRKISDEEAAELGVYFYLRGKLARWTDAVVTGRRVSDDTLHDIGVYVRMAQRIREKGSWPGV